MPYSVQRPLVAQQFRTFPVTVGIAPTPIQSNVDLNELLTTFVLTIPVAAANSVFLGNAGVTVTTGLELLAGTSSVFKIDQEGRQLYELQAPLLNVASALTCRDIDPQAIPFIVWDLSTVFLVAAAPTNITAATFKAMYI